MNEFLEQFLIEARDLVGQASSDLMALEQTPEDRPALDGLFRAFHTLKGAAAIVDFDAMGTLMHAMEDALAGARTDSGAIAKHLIDRSFECLDMLERWLWEIQTTDALPPGAETSARALMSNLPLQNRLEADAAVAPQVDPLGSQDWLEEFSAESRAKGRVVVRYAPEKDCFFRGQDPLATLKKLPGLVSLKIKPAAFWPDLEELNPFECALTFYALSNASHGEVAEYLVELGGEAQCLFYRSESTEPPAAQIADRLLRAQLALLADQSPDGLVGRIQSAGCAAGNVLRHLGRAEEAREIDTARQESGKSGQTETLSHRLRQALDPTSRSVSPITPGTQLNADLHVEATSSLRVDVKRVDAIVKLTGEITVVKNAIGHLSVRAAKEAVLPDFVKALQTQSALLQRLTDELQRSVVAVRVLPLRHVFQRFPRLVRDIASRLGKAVNLTTQGEVTEADKVVVEGLFEPLLHILRNALDHGVETSAARQAAGKAAMASIQLRAYREGEHVVVEVADDGRGIDIEAIKRVALSRQIVTENSLSEMTDAQVVEIIFMPGFSAAETVTDLSGRGVGMDAVRTAVRQLGGEVIVKTVRSAGTTVRLTLPFSVMMTRIMTLEASGQFFGLPFETIVEMVRLPREKIVSVGAAKAVVFRGQTVPLISLPAALGRTTGDHLGAFANVVVARVGSEIGALEVDRFGQTLDAMLNAKSGLLIDMPGVVGTTLLGDGRVLIVLDLKELLQ
jgi:two-component system chemotaxis sensor kinase CheA